MALLAPVNLENIRRRDARTMTIRCKPYIRKWVVTVGFRLAVPDWVKGAGLCSMPSLDRLGQLFPLSHPL